MQAENGQQDNGVDQAARSEETHHLHRLVAVPRESSKKHALEGGSDGGGASRKGGGTSRKKRNDRKAQPALPFYRAAPPPLLPRCCALPQATRQLRHDQARLHTPPACDCGTAAFAIVERYLPWPPMSIPLSRRAARQREGACVYTQASSTCLLLLPKGWNH